MKKIFLLAAAVLCMASAASAQTFSKGDQNISATVGLGGGYGIPIGVSYEKGMWDIGSDNNMAIGLGGFVGFSSYAEDFGTYKYTYSNIYLAAEGNFHFTEFSKWDLYAGLRLGYNVASGSWDDDSVSDLYSVSTGGLIYTTHIGANYFLNDTWAINAELGYGIASLSAGVTYKF
ncbi:MAG: outer membrane beta-barrel protein [Rikenellaceae bacterium]